MIRRLFFFTGWFLLLVTAAEAGADLPPEAGAVRTHFRTLAGDLAMERDDELAGLNRRYLDTLQRIEEQMRGEGNLDGVLAVRRERELLEQADGAPLPRPAPEIPDLAALRARYQAARVERLHDLSRKALLLAEQYLAVLERFEQQAVSGDRIPEALAIRAERDTVRSHPLLLAARRELDRSAPEETTETPPAPAPANGDLAPNLYRPGEEPRRELNELTLRFTGMKSRSMALRVQARLFFYVDSEDERGSRERSNWSVSRTSSGFYSYFPRLHLTLPRNEALDGATVVFEYFSQPLDDRGSFTRVRTEHLPLPSLAGGDALVVDGSGIRLFQYQSQYRSTHGRYRSDTRRGATFYGLIASIYDADGEQVFQRTDKLPLVDEASDSPPPPLNDERGVLFDADAGRRMIMH